METYMHSEEFADIQHDLDLSDRDLATVLGLNKNGHRQIRRIKEGKVPCSGPMAVAMLALEEGFRPDWAEGLFDD